MAIETRLALVKDASGIGAVHGRSWQVAYRGIVPDAYLDAIDLDERGEHWATILRGEMPVPGVADATNLVATIDENVVGFACFGAFRQEPDNPAAAELWALYVDPDQWGVGAGHRLMQVTLAALADAKAERAYLWVLADNAQARRFYHRAGWSDDSVSMNIEIAGASIEEVRYSIPL